MDVATNALLIDGDHPLSLPAFDRIRAEDFGPALARAMQQHADEIAALRDGSEPPDFHNTVAAFDRSGALLLRIESVFHNLAASATSPALQAVRRELAAPLSAHWSAVHQDAGLFARLAAVHARREALGLSAEQQRLVERLHRDFVRAGAQLPAAARAEFATLAGQLAELNTRFAQNVLHDEASFTLPLPDRSEERRVGKECRL